MKLGIMGAMTEEVSGILQVIEATETRRIGGRDYVVGRWHGLDVVAVFSRWGKVAAAVTASVLFAEFGVDGIVFVGVAGAVDSALGLGDVVVGSECLQYDMDISAIPGFERFEIPLLGRARFPAHAPWLALARHSAERFLAEDFAQRVDESTQASFAIQAPKVVTGLIASGDRFVNDPALIRDLRSALPDLRCVEMEGGAVAQISYEFDRPCVVIRVISDRADHDAPVDFQRFVSSVASVMTAEIASRVVQGIAAETSAAAIR